MDDTKPRRMSGCVAAAVLATAVGLVGCGGTSETVGESPSPSRPAQSTSEPLPAQSPSAKPAASSNPTPSPPQSTQASESAASPGTGSQPPDRSEMDEYTLQFAETFLVAEVRKLDIGQLYSDQELIDAAHVNCDSWESGKPLRGVLVEVAETLPRLESTEAVATFAGVATGILCASFLPER